MVYDLGYMIYKVFSVVIIRSGERGWISNHICFTKKNVCQNNVDSAAYSRIGSYAPAFGEFKIHQQNKLRENISEHVDLYIPCHKNYNICSVIHTF